jgi:hypothetical protein
MKALFSILTIVTTLFVTGCTTTSGPSPSPINSGTVAVIEQIAITTLTAEEVSNDLKSHPGNLAYYQTGEQLLGVLEGSTNQITIANVSAALAQAGQNSPSSQLIAMLVVNVLDADLQQNGSASVISNAQVKQALAYVVTGVNEGISLYQASLPTPPVTPTPLTPPAPATTVVPAPAPAVAPSSPQE